MSERLEIEDVKLRVETPPGYTAEGTRRHALLLTLTAGLQATEWTDRLHGEGILPEMIVVTVEEGGAKNPAGLIPAIASRYRVLESPAARWICGAAHDGVAAFRAVLDHPEFVGAAACLSTSFEGAEGAPPPHSPMLRELESLTALPTGTRLCFDYGTVGLDECYEPYHRDLGAILRAKGWRDGKEFTVTRSTEGSHDPASWQSRLGPALRWLAGR